ncbi:hypothetical protein [Staphylococcus saprophyticus]|uniref:hypothetical protein n=1 Tax=Staphylococcus saprophyticus TaxID=29385 RepID=UPI0011A906B7|nr:hypothetical protein [Staphylococcus saprophyticus]
MKEGSGLLDEIEELYRNVEVENIDDQDEGEGLRLMEDGDESKIGVFECLKGWVDDELVGESWLDRYEVMRDDRGLNDGLRYLVCGLR